MENNYTAFVQNLHRLVFDLNRYVPNDGSKNFLKVFDKLDMGKVMLRYLSTMREYETELQAKDESLFTLIYDIFPGIKLDEIWPQLSSSRKKKVWTYLQILYIQSELVLDYESAQQSTDKKEVLEGLVNNVNQYNNEVKLSEKEPIDKDVDKQNTKKEDSLCEGDTSIVTTNPPLEFNPFVGVGESNVEYSTTDMFAGVENLPDEEMTPGLSSFASMIGIDKMIPNLDQLKDQLKNMNKEDIDEATNNIKSLLGDNVNEETSNLISDMLTNITDELKKEQANEEDPLKNIFKIAETVATKMKSKVENSNVDMKELLNSTQNIANNCKDQEGNPLFNKNANPFAMLSQMLDPQMQGPPGPMDPTGSGGLVVEELDGEPLPNQPNQNMPQLNMTPEQQQFANQMLQNFGLAGGLGNIDLNNIDLNQLNNQLNNQINSQSNNPNRNGQNRRMRRTRPNPKKGSRKR